MERFIEPQLRREFLAEFPVVVATPVAWGDMDFFRHVNNIVFFRYFESARIAYLERIGFEREMAESGIGPILGATDCRFRRPVTYPDVVVVGARTVEVSDDRFRMEYRLVSENQREVAAVGGGTLVAFDYRRNQKAQLPAAIRSAIDALEGGSSHPAVETEPGRAR